MVMRRLREALGDFVYGSTVFDMVRKVEELVAYHDFLLMLVVLGDMLGYPVLSYYKLRLLPACYPKLDSWKKVMLEERDITGKVNRG